MSTEQKKATNTRVYVIKVTGGQERNVASLVANRVEARKIHLFSIIYSEKMKGYLLVEATDAQVVSEAVSGVKHVRSYVPGVMTVDEIGGLISTATQVTELKAEQMVEIVGGPFKGMRAKVVRYDSAKKEATVTLVDAPYQLQITIDAGYLKAME
ncbi:MAG: transcription elongation factor Spt5 [Nitrososphaerota archaeon]|nr:transcription elongation factor Spt5 [Nitrososphaerota archaeon]